MRFERYWQGALERSQTAAASGSLVPLDTEILDLGFVPDASVSGKGHQVPGDDSTSHLDWSPFVLRRLLSATPKHLTREGPRPNPFLPWDRELAVAPLGASHLLLLNKYPVQAGHVLVIPQQWQPQHGWLGPADWGAVAEVDGDTGGLWFFNSSPAAGASQPHRHLQLLPRQAGSPSCPMATQFLAQLKGDQHPWPWRYRLSRRHRCGDPDELMALYTDHARTLDLGDPANDSQPRHPYN
ncbi:MAG: ATP adenylyltransferase, partial [Synechococcus sp. ELA619]